MSTFAADKYDEIRAARDAIRASEVQHCPVTPSVKLFACLRTTQKCGEQCPFHHDWIGPDPAAGAYC